MTSRPFAPDVACNVTKAAAATLANLAGLRTIPEPPVILLIVSGLMLAVFRRRLVGAVPGAFQGGPGTRR